MERARVAPLKQITIPRLELTAALVSVKVSTQLKKALEYEDVNEIFWTDSKVVLGYISNDAKRFHVYVANRVQQIRDYTTVDQWRYISSEPNPADDVSRGLDVEELVQHWRWWNGPQFLWHPIEVQQFSTTVSESDPEVKRKCMAANVTLEFCNLLDRLNYFSSWYRAKKAIALCLRLVMKFKIRTVSESRKTPVDPLTVEDIQKAETEIMRLVQHEGIKNEIVMLKSKQQREELKDRNSATCRNKEMKKVSCLYRLDPFLDENNILRVGGRIRRENLAPINRKASHHFTS